MTTLPAEGKTVLFEQIAELMPEHLRRCKVPDALAKRVLLPEPLEETTALRVVRGWLTTGERTLALVGNNGTGKTLAAIWAITKSIHRYQVFRWTPGDLPDDHRGPWRQDMGRAAPRRRGSVPFHDADGEQGGSG